MSVYCERCGVKIENETVKYLVTIHATADFDGTLPAEGGIEDLEAVMRAIDSKNPEEHDHDVYESRGFILCASCKKEFMKNPLKASPLPIPGEESGEGRVH